MITPIDIHRIGVVSTLGIGFKAFSETLMSGGTPEPTPMSADNFAGEAVPPRTARWMQDFNPVEHLGKKGISTLDRTTQFSIIACKQIIDCNNRETVQSERTGIVLGSTAGSLKSIADFIRSTYVSTSPHMVSPMLFPNTVMNCAAAQCAIWLGLKGVNSTVCAGELSGIAALNYASRMLRMEHASRLVAGSVEEFCDYSAWAHHATTAPDAAPVGEGAALFELAPAVERSDSKLQLLATRMRNGRQDAAGADAGVRLGEEIAHMLEAAGISPDSVRWWTRHRSAGDVDPDVHVAALKRAGLSVDGLALVADDLSERIGLTHAASISLQLAAAIATAPPGIGLLTAVSGEGQIGCALIHVPQTRRYH